MALRVGQDGTLLYAGRSDGGDSPFQCGLRNFNRTTPLAVIDGFTEASNMQACGPPTLVALALAAAVHAHAHFCWGHRARRR
jgi:hypothetical protein